MLLPGLLSIFFTALSNKKVYIKIHSFSSIKTVAEKFSSKTMYTGSLYIHLGQCIQKIACIQIFFLFYVTKCKQLHWAFTSCSPGAWNHTEGMTARDQKGKRMLHPSSKISLKLYSFFLCSLLCWHSRSSNAQNSPSLQNEFKMSAKKDFGVANKIIIISAKSPHFPGLFHVSNT